MDTSSTARLYDSRNFPSRVSESGNTPLEKWGRTSISDRESFCYIESKHYLEQCGERKLVPNEIRDLVVQKKVLGITEQNENVYKLWFDYETGKDINIIIRIVNENKIKFITI